MQEYYSRGMSFLPCSPGSYSVICSNKAIADQYRVVSVCHSSYHLPIDCRSTISTPVVCTQRFGEASRRHGEKRRRKWSRRSFRKERISGFKVKGRLGLGWCGVVRDGRGRAGARLRFWYFLRVPSRLSRGKYYWRSLRVSVCWSPGS